MITTTVGSYPKVAERTYGTKLIGTITRWQRKELNDAELERTCQEITKAVIQEQERARLDLVTDGQIRWEDLVTPIARRLDGFEINGLSRWFNNNVYYRRPILHRAPKWTKPILVEEYRWAAQCTKRPVKAVLPGPYTFMKVSEDRYYKNDRKFALTMAELLNREAHALAKAGAPIIQFDEPALGYALPSSHGRARKGVTRREAPDVKLAVEALNVATKGITAKTAVCTYFGSLDGGFEALQRARVDVVGVDVVSDPAMLGVLKRVKITKELALGCLDARNTKLESVGELHALFNVVTKRVPADRLYVSPNCGLEFLPHESVLKKLSLLEQVATQL